MNSKHLPQRLLKPSGFQAFGTQPRPNEPGFVGHHDRLHSVAAPELHQNAPNVGLDSRLAEKQMLRNLPVRLPSSDVNKDLCLTSGEIG